MADDFDESDLEALRKMRKTRPEPYTERIASEMRAAQRLDGRRLRANALTVMPRDTQLNVRVRKETKEMALQIARRHRYNLTEVIELAIVQLHESLMKT